MSQSNRRKIRVLYIHSSNTLFGAEKRLLDIITHASEVYETAALILPFSQGPLGDKAKKAGIPVYTINFKFPFHIKYFKQFIEINHQLKDIIRREHIDVIHLNMPFFVSNFWPNLIWGNHKTIWHLRGLDWLNFGQRFTITFSHAIIGISQAVINTLNHRRINRIFPLNPQKIHLIYDGIKLPKIFSINKETLYPQIKFRTNTILISMIAAIDHVKGQDILISAIKNFPFKQFPQVNFVFIGKPYDNYRNKHYVENCIEQSKDLPIFWLDYQNNIEDHIAACDILICPSRFEGLGTVAIEAMLQKKTVIAANVGGLKEIFLSNNEMFGRLFNKENTQELLKEIIWCLEHKEECIKIGENAQQRAQKMFDFNQNIKQIEYVYNAVIAKSIK